MPSSDLIDVYTQIPALYNQYASSTNICSATEEASKINAAIIKYNEKSSLKFPTKSDCQSYNHQIIIKELYAANTFELGNNGERGFFFLKIFFAQEKNEFRVDVKRFQSKPPTFQVLALQRPSEREVISPDIIVDILHILHPTKLQRVKDFIIDILAQF